MSGIVGHLDWAECETCTHCRPDLGGCVPLDEVGALILDLWPDDETVTCAGHRPSSMGKGATMTRPMMPETGGPDCYPTAGDWQRRAERAEARVAGWQQALVALCSVEGGEEPHDPQSCARHVGVSLDETQAELERYAPVIEAARAQLAARDRWVQTIDATDHVTADTEAYYEGRSAWISACTETDWAAREAGLTQEGE